MIVICEECGEKYDVDETRIKGLQAKSKCKACGFIITITKPDRNAQRPVLPEVTPKEAPSAPLSSGKSQARVSRSVGPDTEPEKVSGSKRHGLGLRAKILILFFFVPIVLFALSTYLFFGQVKSLSGLIGDESTIVVTDMAESIIREKGEAVAREVALYLKTHPNLRRKDFSKDAEFMKIAVQKVGETGYTVLNSAPSQREPWRIRAHPKKVLIGADILNAVKSKLSEYDFERFKRMHDAAVANKKEATGYYRFLDDEEKFASFAAVEGTDLWILSTTYIDEFTFPMQKLQERVRALTAETLRIVVANVGVTVLLVAIIAFFYGLRLSGNIRSLTRIADRISVGDLDAEFNIKSKDELGGLAEAIGRMQESIRFSIERLHRRRRSESAVGK